jgi:hypothetical protein
MELMHEVTCTCHGDWTDYEELARDLYRRQHPGDDREIRVLKVEDGVIYAQVLPTLHSVRLNITIGEPR